MQFASLPGEKLPLHIVDFFVSGGDKDFFNRMGKTLQDRGEVEFK